MESQQNIKQTSEKLGEGKTIKANMANANTKKAIM
jgi:hypothetical protein